MGQCPGQVPCNQYVEALWREGRLFCIHDLKLCIHPKDTDSFFCLFDHVRRQVDPGGIMPFRCEDKGKEARPGPQVQDPQCAVMRDIAVEFRKPSCVLFVLKFPDSLRLKCLGPVGPVMSYTVFDQFQALSS